MTDSSLWQQSDDHLLIEHILARYHQTHRQQLAELLPLAATVAAAHSNAFPAEVLPLLQNMQTELLSHMLKEERVLFPLILNGAGANAAMPIRMMMHEHDEHEHAIAQLLAATNQLCPPADACTSWQRLYADIQTLIDDLRQHIVLENQVLFTRTLA